MCHMCIFYSIEHFYL